jgi:hypothetical protein
MSTSKPGATVAMGGMSGNAGCGFADVTPTPRILPPFMSGATVL